LGFGCVSIRGLTGLDVCWLLLLANWGIPVLGLRVLGLLVRRLRAAVLSLLVGVGRNVLSSIECVLCELSVLVLETACC
jgi:hypothetical protein